MEYLHYIYKGGCLDDCTSWSNAGTLNWLHRLIKQKYILDKAKVTVNADTRSKASSFANYQYTANTATRNGSAHDFASCQNKDSLDWLMETVGLLPLQVYCTSLAALVYRWIPTLSVPWGWCCTLTWSPDTVQAKRGMHSWIIDATD
jgi:hypothetical protein